MPSRSSKREIVKRALKMFSRGFLRDDCTVPPDLLEELLQYEYDFIPDDERVGKGMVYVVQAVAQAFHEYMIEKIPDLEKRMECMLSIASKLPDETCLVYFAAQVTAFVARVNFQPVIPLVLDWATREAWDVRENACYPVMVGLKYHAEETIAFLNDLARNPDENLRRLCAESTRPKRGVKWLRDPTRNDPVIELLTRLNHDPSIYVRKSVGNNLKDLSKYMPVKVLDTIERWLREGKQLQSKAKEKALLWTIYQALRWLKKKEPRFLDRIRSLVGQDYLDYFDEKRNRWAVPREG